MVILDHPFLLFGVSVVALWLSLAIGGLIGERRPLKDDEKEDFGYLISASLTLLALIVGFSFSMAVSRYDMRKNYEEEEANAIGTEYARTNLLASDDAARVRHLLRQYLDRRLLFYTTHDPRQLGRIDSDTTQLQNEMWSIVAEVSQTRPTPPIALVLSGMNDVLNTQGYTQAAWWNRIPVGAWSLMLALAIFCCGLIGYRTQRKGLHLLVLLPIILSISFFLVADIDNPRLGVIRVSPQNLTSLSQSLHKQ
jgi:hypothetical protein